MCAEVWYTHYGRTIQVYMLLPGILGPIHSKTWKRNVSGAGAPTVIARRDLYTHLAVCLDTYPFTNTVGGRLHHIRCGLCSARYIAAYYCYGFLGG